MCKEFRKDIFSSRLRALLDEKGYSVNKISEITNISRRSFNLWLNEYEKTSPNTKQLFTLIY